MSIDNFISGTFGSDTIRGTNENDAIVALSGSDSVRGLLGDDDIAGGLGSDRVEGDRGNDILLGNGGNDVILGGRGNDFINGGQGSDVLSGGLDSDTFSFTQLDFTRNATDVITDFRLGEDQLSFLGLSIVDVSLGQSALQTLNGEDLRNGALATDLTLTVQDLFGRQQTIVILDAWSSSNNAGWDAYFESLGFSAF